MIGSSRGLKFCIISGFYLCVEGEMLMKCFSHKVILIETQLHDVGCHFVRNWLRLVEIKWGFMSDFDLNNLS